MCCYLDTGINFVSNWSPLLVESHQNIQKKILVSKQSLEGMNKCIVELASKLSSVERVMEQIVDENMEMISRIENANAKSLSVPDLVRYAQATSYTSAAPPHWQPGAPLGPFSAPYPSEIQMRSGCLSMDITGMYVVTG